MRLDCFLPKGRAPEALNGFADLLVCSPLGSPWRRSGVHMSSDVPHFPLQLGKQLCDLPHLRGLPLNHGQGGFV